MKLHVVFALISVAFCSWTGLTSEDPKMIFGFGVVAGIGVGLVTCTLIEDSIKRSNL